MLPSRAPADPIGSKPSFYRAPWFAALVIAGAAALAYGNSFHGPFIFDDVPSILSNATIREWSSAWRPPSDHGVTVAGRPVLNFSLALNYAISGTEVWSYHALNLFIHALAGIVLFDLVRRTLQAPRLQRDFATGSGAFALAVALVWTLHPLQTEAVTYVVQRAESLAAIFYLLTLWCYVRSTDAVKPAGWWAGAVLACAAGMATKEIVVSAPLVALLYDRTFLTTSWRETWQRRRALLCGLGVTWLILIALVAGTNARGGTAGFATPITPLNYLVLQGSAIAHYLRLAVWPHPLVFDYGRASSDAAGSTLSAGFFFTLTLALVSAWGAWKKSIIGFCGLFFFAVLAPSSSVVPIATQTVAEHRMYLPLAAVAAVLVGLCSRWLGSRFGWSMVVIAIALGWATQVRNRDYRDALAIWTDTVAKRADNPRAQNNLALELQKRGQTEAANEHFRAAIKFDPDYVQALSNVGAALTAQGLLPEAVERLERAVQIAPDYPDARLNLGNALVKSGRSTEAVEQFRAAVRLKPEADGFFNLGIALSDLGRDAEAEENFRSALNLNPQLTEAHYQLGRLIEKSRQTPAAINEYEQVLKLTPAHVGAHRRLALLEAQANRLPAAAGHFLAVIQAEPSDVDARANLGNVYLLQGQPKAAVTQYEAALRLRPGDARLQENLALARESLR